jgi:catechol 2,3-dioxygenase-like lactoylglutathione lyase family enzyme
MISDLSHITLICKNIDKTGEFLKKIFGAVEYYATEKKVYSLSREKFFKIGKLWIVTMEGEPVAKTYNHIAFQADAEKFKELREEIKKLGLNVLEGRKRTEEEGDSIYFYDYDNHLFELHSGDLDQRLKYYQACDVRK